MDIQDSLNNITRKLKDIFDFGPKTIVGIDIGQNAIKVASMSGVNNGKYKLSKFALVPLPEGSIIDDEIHREDDVIEALQHALKRAKISSNKACLGVSGPSTVTKRLQLAGGTNDEIEDQVFWEAEQYIPFNIDETALSFHLIGENEGGGVNVLVAAAKNIVVQTFSQIIEALDVRVKIVDINLIAMTNIFEYLYSDTLEESDSSQILLDIGAQTTQFVIYRGGSIVFTKEMSSGGGMITEEIQRQMGVNYNDAENLKTVGDENGSLPEDIIEIVDAVNDSFYADIKKTIEFYITSTSDESFEKVYITGGGALTAGLIDGLEETLGLDVEVINPFEKIEVDKKFTDDELDEIGYRGVVAMGLAIRKVK